VGGWLAALRLTIIPSWSFITVIRRIHSLIRDIRALARIPLSSPREGETDTEGGRKTLRIQRKKGGGVRQGSRWDKGITLRMEEKGEEIIERRERREENREWEKEKMERIEWRIGEEIIES
jgi:hypothetical protein